MQSHSHPNGSVSNNHESARESKEEWPDGQRERTLGEGREQRPRVRGQVEEPEDEGVYVYCRKHWE
jgi:hypothetical protein